MTQAAELGTRSRSLAWSVLAGGAGQGALIVSGVLAARILGVEDRGYLALFAVFPAILAQAGSLGLPLAATFALSRDPDRAAATVRVLGRPAAVQTVTLTLVHGAIVVALFADEPGDVRLGALLTLLAVPIALAQQYGLAILQGRKRFRDFNVYRTLPAVLYSVAVGGIFVAGGGDLPSVTVAWIAASALAAAATLLVALRGLSPAGDGEAPSVAELARFGIRGLLGWMSPVETFRLDQAVVGLFLSPAALGLYVVGLAFANLPRFLAQSIGFVAYPRVAAHEHGRAARAELWHFVWVTVVVCSAVVGALELAAGALVPLFFGDAFSDAVGVTRILLVNALFLAVRRILTDGAQGLGRPGLGTAAEAASWLFLLPGLAALTPLFGVEGVALALTIASGLALAVLAWLLHAGERGGERAPAGPLTARGAGR